MKKPLLILGLLLLLGFINTKSFLPIVDEDDDLSFSEDFKYSKAIIRSAGGWKLNKSPQAKKFLFDVAPKYGIETEMNGKPL